MAVRSPMMDGIVSQSHRVFKAAAATPFPTTATDAGAGVGAAEVKTAHARVAMRERVLKEGIVLKSVGKRSFVVD